MVVRGFSFLCFFLLFFFCFSLSTCLCFSSSFFWRWYTLFKLLRFFNRFRTNLVRFLYHERITGVNIMHTTKFAHRPNARVNKNKSVNTPGKSKNINKCSNNKKPNVLRKYRIQSKLEYRLISSLSLLIFAAISVSLSKPKPRGLMSIWSML